VTAKQILDYDVKNVVDDGSDLYGKMTKIVGHVMKAYQAGVVPMITIAKDGKVKLSGKSCHSIMRSLDLARQRFMDPSGSAAEVTGTISEITRGEFQIKVLQVPRLTALERKESETAEKAITLWQEELEQIGKWMMVNVPIIIIDKYEGTQERFVPVFTVSTDRDQEFKSQEMGVNLARLHEIYSLMNSYSPVAYANHLDEEQENKIIHVNPEDRKKGSGKRKPDALITSENMKVLVSSARTAFNLGKIAHAAGADASLATTKTGKKKKGASFSESQWCVQVSRPIKKTETNKKEAKNRPKADKVYKWSVGMAYSKKAAPPKKADVKSVVPKSIDDLLRTADMYIAENAADLAAVQQSGDSPGNFGMDNGVLKIVRNVSGFHFTTNMRPAVANTDAIRGAIAAALGELPAEVLDDNTLQGFFLRRFQIVDTHLASAELTKLPEEMAYNIQIHVLAMHLAKYGYSDLARGVLSLSLEMDIPAGGEHYAENFMQFYIKGYLERMVGSVEALAGPSAQHTFQQVAVVDPAIMERILRYFDESKLGVVPK
jgi:hypothetical protein